VEKCDVLVDLGRRRFLRGASLGAAGAAVATLLPQGAQAAATPAALVDYPSNRLANISDLKVNVPMDVAYPDADAAGVLIKLGTKVPTGAGPDGDIVAFSAVCPHKGFTLNYVGDDKTLNCPGHYSRFDVERGGQEIWGHATQNLPQYVLRVDDKGDIYAEGVDELLFGRLSNVL
jgi:arsenite oxidase small subunit